MVTISPDELEQLLVEEGHTQKEVADSLGVSQPVISRLKQEYDIDADKRKSARPRYVCKVCGDPITTPPSKQRIFCSIECKNSFMTPVTID